MYVELISQFPWITVSPFSLHILEHTLLESGILDFSSLNIYQETGDLIPFLVSQLSLNKDRNHSTCLIHSLCIN